MAELTAERLKNLGVSRVFLMATEGTIKTGVYKKYLDKHNIGIVSPSEDEIKEMTRVIYDEVKAGKKTPDAGGLYKIAGKYIGLGCEKIILGCTELSTLHMIGEDFVDAMEILKDGILEAFVVK